MKRRLIPFLLASGLLAACQQSPPSPVVSGVSPQGPESAPAPGAQDPSAPDKAQEPTPSPGAALALGFGDVPPQSWLPRSPLAIARAAHSLVAMNGALYAIGGDFNDLIERYDPVLRQWAPRRIPNQSAIAHPIGQAAALRNRIVMVANDREYLGAPEIAAPIFFDPESLDAFTAVESPQWSSFGNLVAPRTAAGVVSDGETLYLLGGSSKRYDGTPQGYVWVDSPLVEALSARTQQWHLAAPMPTSRGSLGVAMLGGKIYAAGGFRWVGTPAQDSYYGAWGVNANAGASMQALGAFEAYDPVLDTWATCSAMPTARHSLSLVAANGRLYALGGANAENRALSTVESYDPATDTWRTEPPMTTKRALLAAAALSERLLVVTGGMDASGRPLRTAEAFNPEVLP
ncbi:MAG TPA: kelch repeat-containing protein [Pantanalinema sp.]